MAASCYLLDGHIFPRFGEIRYQFLLPTLDEEGAKSETAYELVASRSEDGRIEVTLPASFKAQPVPIEARDAIFKTLKAATGLESSEVEEMCLSPSVSSTIFSRHRALGTQPISQCTERTFEIQPHDSAFSLS